jgi:molybdenum cofactor biosynthesis enzyme
MTDPIEGRAYDVTNEDIQAINYIKTQIQSLDHERRNEYATLLIDAQSAKRNINLSANKSHRRYEIARGILLLMQDGQFDRDLVKGICSHITKQEYLKAGEALGHLNAQQAEQFAQICYGITADQVTIQYIPEQNTFSVQEVRQ